MFWKRQEKKGNLPQTSYYGNKQFIWPREKRKTERFCNNWNNWCFERKPCLICIFIKIEGQVSTDYNLLQLNAPRHLCGKVCLSGHQMEHFLTCKSFRWKYSTTVIQQVHAQDLHICCCFSMVGAMLETRSSCKQNQYRSH